MNLMPRSVWRSWEDRVGEFAWLDSVGWTLLVAWLVTVSFLVGGWAHLDVPW